jgi:hypothetical protein
VVTPLDALHQLANLSHYSPTLMTKHKGSVRLIPIIAEIYIRMANAGSNYAHQNFIVTATFDLKRFELQRATSIAQHGCLNLLHRHFGAVSQCSTPFINWHRSEPLCAPLFLELQALSFILLCQLG